VVWKWWGWGWGSAFERTRGGGGWDQKIEIRAIAAQIQSAYGLQEVEGGSVASQGPLPW